MADRLIMPRWLGFMAAALFLAAPAGAEDRASLIEGVLEDPSWTAIASPVEFGADELGDLVGENAGAARVYGFDGAARVRLRGPGGEVEATLYEMIDSTAAFGLFALERDWRSEGFESARVGAEGYRQGGRLVFWQSNYVVKLEGPPEAAEALSDRLAGAIPGRSRKAPVSRHLPPEGLIPESEKYILTPAAFRETVGIDPADLGFENSVEVAVADYRTPEGAGRVAMLLYPTQHLALRHVELWEAGRGDRPPHGRSGPLVAIVADSSGADLSESMLDSLAYQSEVTWNEPLPDPLTLPHLILTVFAWIGIALAFTVVVGVSFGGFRIYMKRRYPGRIFGRDDESEFIQLNIDQSVTSRRLNP